ncbi:histone acetyltransferase KAT6B-like [Aethina tumida]|uniref:histone acetyltransferase KAT6B-like n=1 Tax=Aethina tumida TaxID=116153 RepID=UPI0021479D48|nr:histone acetyltransferase KAT6B-like [Aethina tumida]
MTDNVTNHFIDGSFHIFVISISSFYVNYKRNVMMAATIGRESSSKDWKHCSSCGRVLVVDLAPAPKEVEEITYSLIFRNATTSVERCCKFQAKRAGTNVQDYFYKTVSTSTEDLSSSSSADDTVTVTMTASHVPQDDLRPMEAASMQKKTSFKVNSDENLTQTNRLTAHWENGKDDSFENEFFSTEDEEGEEEEDEDDEDEKEEVEQEETEEEENEKVYTKENNSLDDEVRLEGSSNLYGTGESVDEFLPEETNPADLEEQHGMTDSDMLLRPSESQQKIIQDNLEKINQYRNIIALQPSELHLVTAEGKKSMVFTEVSNDLDEKQYLVKPVLEKEEKSGCCGKFGNKCRRLFKKNKNKSSI